MNFLIAFAIAFFGSFVAMPFFLFWVRVFSIYVVVRERECVVFELFGKVRLTINEPGIHFPWLTMGPFAALVPIFGRKRTVDLRLDQVYLRSQPVNSEEGAPMGIGVWCEMFVSDPIAYLYKNTDPVGSLRANVSNATVRCLSNMKLSDMLENRHPMSNVVREEVSDKSRQWGYMLGSTYIRKVHFRDVGMIQQIEQKVVNRLRQVTSSIQQDGANRVNVIRSTAERSAAVEFARAAATRPQIVGAALAEISRDAVISGALFELLETQSLLQSNRLEVSIVPKGMQLLAAMPGSGGIVGGQ
ncbi:MAG: putative stomatin/prohibitin-family rane protease subunit YbbK [Polyangiaceae bacterium]|jgi:regulator of protease activity HflC (stomatin/prohibitin superfamily)|nr:putative stomatin/prohibitin-family rane protease subunit YbbK [Polyangiaceae bacterium]